MDAIVEKLGLHRLDCIKLDKASYDLEVLCGAQHTLDRLNPWVIVELTNALAKRGRGIAEALEWLAARGYGKALVLDGRNFAFRRIGSVQKTPLRQSSIETSYDTRPVFKS